MTATLPPGRPIVTLVNGEIRLKEWFAWGRALLAVPSLSPAAKLTAVSLAFHRDARTEQLNPSFKRLAEMTAQSERTVFRHMEQIIATGRVRMSGHGGGVSNHYVLILLEADTMTAVAKPKRKGVLPRVSGLKLANHDNPGSPTMTNTPDEPCQPCQKNSRNNKSNKEPLPLHSTTGFKDSKAKRAWSAIGSYRPDSAAREWASQYFHAKDRPDLAAAIDDCVEEFVDHHQMKATRTPDWDSAWRTWCRRAVGLNRLSAKVVPLAIVRHEVVTEDGWATRIRIWFGIDDSNQPPGRWHAKWGPKPGEVGCLCPHHIVEQVKAEAATFGRTRVSVGRAERRTE